MTNACKLVLLLIVPRPLLFYVLVLIFVLFAPYVRFYIANNLYVRKQIRTSASRICFRYTDITLPLLLKSEISSFYSASVTSHTSETALLVFPRGGLFFSAVSDIGF